MFSGRSYFRDFMVSTYRFINVAVGGIDGRRIMSCYYEGRSNRVSSRFREIIAEALAAACTPNTHEAGMKLLARESPEILRKYLVALSHVHAPEWLIKDMLVGMQLRGSYTLYAHFDVVHK